MDNTPDTPTTNPDQVSIQVMIPVELKERVEAAARQRVVGRNALVTALLAAGLEQLKPVEQTNLDHLFGPD